MTRTRMRVSALDGIAAVHRDGRAGDEIGGGAGQEYGDARKVVRHPPPPRRRAGQDAVVEPGDVLARLDREIGVDPAGQDGVDLDPVLGPRRGEPPGELNDPALP